MPINYIEESQRTMKTFVSERGDPIENVVVGAFVHNYPAAFMTAETGNVGQKRGNDDAQQPPGAQPGQPPGNGE